MTFREFCVEVSKIKGWQLTGSGIRKSLKDGREVCPICAVYNKRIRKNTYDCDVEIPAKKLGLRRSNKIMTAADTSMTYLRDYQQDCISARNSLLKACGLTETN